MNAIAFHSVNNLPVGQRQLDGYVDATHLCRASNKKWNDYFRLESTKEFLSALSTNLGLPVIVNNPEAGITASALVLSFKGGNSQQGTWVHPQVAIHLAMWLKAEFAVMVTQWVVEWMSKGSLPAASLAEEIVQMRIEIEELKNILTTQPQQPAKVVYLPPAKLELISDDYLKHETAEQRERRVARERLELSTWMRRAEEPPEELSEAQKRR